MLISFSVANFRSFGEEVTLNMVASNKLADHQKHCIPIADTGKSVLRASIIYGANAAGKSNLVRAIAFAQGLISESGERQQFEPFRFAVGTAATPSSFEFRFLIGNRVFIYGFDFQNKFVDEWLYVQKGDDEVELFKRNGDGKVIINATAEKLFADDPTMFPTMGVLSQLQIRGDQLFLNRVFSLPEAAQGETLKSIIGWFTKTLVVLPVNSRSADLFDRLQDDSRFRSFCSIFLSNVGTGIKGLEIALREREGKPWENQYLSNFPKTELGFNPLAGADTDVILKPDKPGMVIERKLVSQHHVTPHNFSLPFSEESDGTQSLLHLMPILASPPNDSLVVVLDELDRSLHPLLCWEFVRFFSESCPGARRQLIVTTHEAHLLNQSLLRRDEYWFAEKDSRQQTQLTSLVDFKIRSDLKVEKGYLQGRFGAIPIIGGMGNLEKLLECGEEGRRMPHKQRKLDRDGGKERDASLIIIASEDKYAVADYFRRFKTRKVQFVVVPTEDTHSSPEAVLERLVDRVKETAVVEGDSFWLCIDRDRWPERVLAHVLKKCQQRGFSTALSHPCFELCDPLPEN